MAYLIYCEESGDKGLRLVEGASNYYVITAIITHENKAQMVRDRVNIGRREILKHRKPLEWKTLETKTKNNDQKLSEFLDHVQVKNENGRRDFVIS